MNNDVPEKKAPKYKNVSEAARIYLLPNFFTAGNMFCGFMALCQCIEAKYSETLVAANAKYMFAVYLIFGACVFDLFDGRMARMFKKESLFGAEFDSIADTVSFGIAPAFLVYFLILDPERSVDSFSGIIASLGPLVGFVYLLCVGIRLAKFNVLTNPLVPGNADKGPATDFMGISSPIAAAITASFVLLLTHDPEDASKLREWLPVILIPVMLLVSFLMVTNIPFPTFKHINWNKKAKAQAFICAVLFVIFFVKFHIFAIPVALLCYVLYGLCRGIKRKISGQNGVPAANLGASEGAESVPEEDTF